MVEVEKSSHWYCPLPFKSVFLDSTGVSPCCQIPRQPVDLESWKHNPLLNYVQSTFSQGNLPSVCQQCSIDENSMGRSLRTEALRDYGGQIFVDLDIDNVDFRSSNICNFKCRTCDPVFSHGINQEVIKHPRLEKYYNKPVKQKTVMIEERNQSWILENISKIKRFMFTGGEPTFMPRVKEMLSVVMSKGHPEVEILITTNGSFTDEFWFDLTRKTHRLHWTISLDAAGQDAEYIRHGTDWTVIEKNARWLAKHANSLDVNTVISNLNVMKLYPLLSFVKELQELSRHPVGRHGDLGCRHQFFVCQNHDKFDATNWPLGSKSLVLDYLSRCLELDLDQEQATTIKSLMSIIEKKEFDQRAWDHAMEFNRVLDDVRGQNYVQMMTEPVLQ